MARGQSGCSRRFCGRLCTFRPGDACDRKIAVLFYSVLHRINYWLVKETGRAPGSRLERNSRVEEEMQSVFKDYNDPCPTSMRTRYRDGHRPGGGRRRAAVEAADRIEAKIPFPQMPAQ